MTFSAAKSPADLRHAMENNIKQVAEEVKEEAPKSILKKQSKYSIEQSE